jgi:hypothetical protein
MSEKKQWEKPSIRRMEVAEAKAGLKGTHSDAVYAVGSTVPLIGGRPAIFS